MKKIIKQRAKIKLFKHQKEFVLSEATYPALVGGLGCGKTEAGVYRMINLMYKNKEIFEKTGKRYRFGVYMPNNSYFKDPIIPRFELILKQLGHEVIVNKTDFTIKIDDHSEIVMKSLDDPTKLISYEVHDSWIDELDTMSFEKAEKSFQFVNTRNRAKKIDGKDNTVGITTTPEGHKFVYKTWVTDLEDLKEGDEKLEMYKIIKGKTKYNFMLPKKYLIQNFGKFSKSMYLAYAEGEFINFTSKPVYSDYNRKRNMTKLEWNGEDLYIGMDFNVNNMSAVVGIMKDKYVQKNKKLYIIDEIYENSLSGKNIKDTNEMILEIKKKYPRANITIYPDAAGNQKNSSNYYNTNIILLKKHFKVKLNYRTSKSKPMNPRVSDRITVVNSSFINLLGETKVYINADKCKKLVYNLENQSYKRQGNGYVPDKSSGMDHMIDALGYLVFYEFSGRDLHKKVGIIKSSFF